MKIENKIKFAIIIFIIGYILSWLGFLFMYSWAYPDLLLQFEFFRDMNASFDYNLTQYLAWIGLFFVIAGPITICYISIYAFIKKSSLKELFSGLATVSFIFLITLGYILYYYGRYVHILNSYVHDQLWIACSIGTVFIALGLILIASLVLTFLYSYSIVKKKKAIYCFSIFTLLVLLAAGFYVYIFSFDPPYEIHTSKYGSVNTLPDDQTFLKKWNETFSCDYDYYLDNCTNSSIIDNYTICLKSRGSFIPRPGIANETWEKILSSNNERYAVYIQFYDLPLDENQSDELKNLDVTTYYYLNENTFSATIPNASKTIEKIINLSFVRWIGEKYPADKISSDIIKNGVSNHAINDNGSLNMYINFYGDLSEEDSIKILEEHKVISYHGGSLFEKRNMYKVIITYESLLGLIKENYVYYIEEEEVPSVPD